MAVVRLIRLSAGLHPGRSPGHQAWMLSTEPQLLRNAMPIDNLRRENGFLKQNGLGSRVRNLVRLCMVGTLGNTLTYEMSKELDAKGSSGKSLCRCRMHENL